MAHGQSVKRRGRDSNPGWTCIHAGFQDRCNRPLCHLSKCFSSQQLQPNCVTVDRAWLARWLAIATQFAKFAPMNRRGESTDFFT